MVLQILELIDEVDEYKDKRRGGRSDTGTGGIIFFGIVYIVVTFAFTLFASYVLFSYFKNGSIPVQQARQGGIQDPNMVPPQQPGYEMQPGYPMQNNIPPNRGIVSNPGGVMVGQRIDEDALEGKNPQAANKEFADLELSLNGGISPNDPNDEYHHESIGNNDNDLSNDDTPPDIDIYDRPVNRVVDPKQKPELKSGQDSKPFPQGRFA